MTNFRNILLFILFTLQSCALADDGTKPMTPVDVLSIPILSDPQLSPDGRALVFVHAEVDWEDDKLRRSLWLRRPGKDRAEQITHRQRNVSRPRWSPSGDTIAYLTKPDGANKNQIHLLPMNGGEAYQLTDHSMSIREYRWSPEGHQLYFTARKDRSPRGKTDGSLNTRLIPFDSLANKQLWKIDVRSRESKQLTPDDLHIRSFDVSDDGEQIAIEYSSSALIDDRHFNSGLLLIDDEGNELRRLIDRKHECLGPKISPDGRSIVFLADVNRQGENYHNTNLFLIDIQGDRPAELLIPKFPGEVLSARWAQDSRSVYFTANLGLHSQLFELKLPSQTLHKLTAGKHGVIDWDYSPARECFALQLRTSRNPGDFWILAGQEGQQPEQFTKLCHNYLSSFSLPEQRAVHWDMQDGQEIEGLLTLPINYKEGQRYPLVVQTHGGPRASEQYGRWRWKYYRPVLAGHGYAILSANHRGSSGYGDKFMRDMVGDYFRNAHTDVLAGVDYLIEQGIADPEKLAVMGWSAGGHMTNKLITVTDRFKVAASGAGAVDWVSMYGESDNRYLRTPWFGGSPWQKDAPWQAFRDQSPLKDMWRVKTPTLIFVGGNDERVPATQSKLMSRALAANGVTNELYIAPNCGHDWPDPSLRLFKINKELEWFERYLHQNEYQWQEIPTDESESGSQAKDS